MIKFAMFVSRIDWTKCMVDDRPGWGRVDSRGRLMSIGVILHCSLQARGIGCGCWASRTNITIQLTSVGGIFSIQEWVAPGIWCTSPSPLINTSRHIHQQVYHQVPKFLYQMLRYFTQPLHITYDTQYCRITHNQTETLPAGPVPCLLTVIMAPSQKLLAVFEHHFLPSLIIRTSSLFSSGARV